MYSVSQDNSAAFCRSLVKKKNSLRFICGFYEFNEEAHSPPLEADRVPLVFSGHRASGLPSLAKAWPRRGVRSPSHSSHSRCPEKTYGTDQPHEEGNAPTCPHARADSCSNVRRTTPLVSGTLYAFFASGFAPSTAASAAFAASV